MGQVDRLTATLTATPNDPTPSTEVHTCTGLRKL